MGYSDTGSGRSPSVARLQMEGPNLIEQVKAALQCLYGRSYNKEAFKQADSWLQDFQHSDQAWQVADALLSDASSTNESLFFAAETLYSKIKYDFRELQPAQIEGLKQQLVTHLATWGQRPGQLHPFLKKLCVAVAALSVQINWQAVLTELVNLMTTSNVPTELVLELMEVLPDECDSDRLVVDDEVRESFRSQLSSNMPHVLAYLNNMDTAGDANVALLNRVFLCMERWIHYFRDSPAANLVGNKVLHDAFRVCAAGSQTGQVFDSATNLIAEVLHVYPSSPENMGLVQAMVPQVMSLRAAFEEATRTEDTDTARGCCRIFTEMATSYMELLLSPDPLGQEQLVGLVLQCTAHPDAAIASLTLDFWTALLDSIMSLASSKREGKTAEFHACLSQLILVCVQNMRWPEDLDSMEKDQKDDVQDYRYKLGETLREVCHCLGSTYCVSEVAARLQAELAPLQGSPELLSQNWRSIEACLWAIRFMASMIPDDENAVVPGLLSLILQLPADLVMLRITANHVIGRLSRWVKVHQDTARSLYDYLLAGMSHPETASSSALSLRDLLMACGQWLSDAALPLYESLLSAGQNGNFDFRDEMGVLEGLCSVVSTLPYANAKEAQRRMITPVATHLMAMITQHQHQGGGESSSSAENLGPRGKTKSPTKHVMEDLDRLTVIIRYCEPRRRHGAAHREGEPSPSVEMVQLLWPVFEAVRNAFRSSVDVQEKLCRVFKHALRAGKEDFSPLLPTLITFFLQSFRETHISAFLYVSSICVSEFGGKDQAHQQALTKMLEEASQLVAPLLETQESMVNHPDVVEEYFYLVARFLTVCPQPLLQNPREYTIVPFVLDRAIVALGVEHREAQKAVLHFLETLVRTGSSDRVGLRQQVTDVILDKGHALTNTIVYGVVGEMPSYLVDDSGGSLAGLLWALNTLCPQQLQQWVYTVLAQNISEHVAPDSDKTMLMKSVTEHKEKDDFIFTVRRFGRRCRDNTRRWRRKTAVGNGSG